MISARMLIFANRNQGSLRGVFQKAVLSACLAGLLAVCCGFMEVVVAQIETGTIVGTVTDANGAALPGVKVEIRSEATGVTTTVTTNEAGRYQSPPLKPDKNEITATSKGFKTTRPPRRVKANQPAGLNFNLKRGAVTKA